MQIKASAVVFKNHEGDTVFVNPANVLYVRSHRCNRPDGSAEEAALSDIVLINGGSMPVTTSPEQTARALFGDVRSA